MRTLGWRQDRDGGTETLRMSGDPRTIHELLTAHLGEREWEEDKPEPGACLRRR